MAPTQSKLTKEMIQEVLKNVIQKKKFSYKRKNVVMKHKDITQVIGREVGFAGSVQDLLKNLGREFNIKNKNLSLSGPRNMFENMNY